MARGGCLFVAVVVVAACGGDDSPAIDASVIDAAPATDAPPPKVFSVFEPPAPGAGADWGVIPYPSDLYLDDDGFVTLHTLPTGPSPDADFLEFFIGRIHELRGAGVKTNVYLPIDGDVDPATLAGNVVVVDMADGLAELPFDTVWRGDLDMIVAAPRLGSLLQQDHLYAAYVTNGVTDDDGIRLGRAAAFDEAMDLGQVPSDPAIAAAQENLRPLVEALAPDVANSLVTATVFTTDNVTDEMKALRDAVAASPPPASAIQVRTDLDEVFGVQDPAAPPGYSNPGYRNQPHGNVAAVVQGALTLTSFTTDTPGVAGVMDFNGDGTPVAKGTEDVPFTLVLPVGASYDGLPLMVYQGTFGGSRIEMLASADIAAAHGIATIGIDAPHHGDRLESSVDIINEMTGAAGPDGFGDSDQTTSIIRFLQFTSSGGFRSLDTSVARDNTRQAATDLCAVVAFVRNGDLSPVNAALGAAGLPSDLGFHPRAPALAGESVGAMFLTIVAAVEPDAGVALLSVPPGGLVFPTFIHSPPFEAFIAFWYQPFDMLNRVELDVDSAFGARFDPISTFWGDLLQRGESLPYAPFVTSGELRGDNGPHVVVHEVYDDEWVHNQATEWVVGAMGLPRMTISLPEPPPEPGLRFVTLSETPAPVLGNMPGGSTGVLLLWHPAQHGFAYVHEDAKFYEPDFPPLVDLAEPFPVGGFTVQAQTMRAQFFSDYFGGDTPMARDPF